jgi:hypothetical protein
MKSRNSKEYNNYSINEGNFSYLATLCFYYVDADSETDYPDTQIKPIKQRKQRDDY